MYKKFLFLTFVFVLSLASISYGDDPCMIKLDLNNTANNDDANTHPGFTKFSIADSGGEVNGVVIDLGGSIDSRLRIDPNGRDFDDIYRDFIFGISPSEVIITLWGLGVNRECDITMWAYDHQSEPNRLAEWTATWDDINDVNWIFTTDFNGGADNWPPGDGSTDYVGTGKTDYLGRIMLTCTRNPNSPAGQPFAFVNALMVEPQGTFVETNYAHRPQPVDGAEAVSVNTVLKWRKGGLSEKRDVYLGTNFNDVNDANRTNPKSVLASQDQDANTYDPSGSFELAVGKTYYWRVDEVNTTPGPNSFWKGEVWSFNTFTFGQPVAWWKLDDGSGTIATDSSGNGYNATIHGNPVWRTSGSPHGNSGYLDFDGNGDYTDANYIDGGNIQLPDLYTVTLWFKVEGPGQENNRDMFSAVDIADGHGILVEFRGGDSPAGRIRYIHRSPTSQSGGPGYESIYTTTGYNDNAWHHIAVQRAASNRRYVYVDGALVGQDTGNSTAGFGTVPLRIMVGVLRPLLLQRYWDGGIDDVRIYNRALTQTEIKEVMRSKIASGPNPSDSAINVEKTPTLSWLAGLYAANVNGHKVYLDPDEQKVEERGGCQINGVVRTDPCYGPIGPLSINQTYYWAIDEVNDACDPYLWAGDIWSFTTVAYNIVDNFDEYKSPPVTAPEMRKVWNDYAYNYTGMDIFPEWDPNHGTPGPNNWSMRCEYKNDLDPYYSEVTANTVNTGGPYPNWNGLGIDPDWLGMGAKALVLWFYGTAINDPAEQMYVKLTDGDNVSGRVNYPYMNDVTQEEWHEWVIDLQSFVGHPNNVNLSNVKKITIGFDGDGTGENMSVEPNTVYFDDFQLWSSKCVLSERDPNFALVDFAPVGYSASGDCIVDNEELAIMVDDWLLEDDVVATKDPNIVSGPVAYYPLDEGSGTNAVDVAGGHNGTLAGGVSWIIPGIIGSSAIHVPFTEGSRVDINTWNPVGNWAPDTNTGDLTLAVWAKWAGTTGVEQGIISKRDLVWDVNGLMFGLVISDWPAYPPLQFVLRGSGSNDVNSGDIRMDDYLGRWTHFAATVDENVATLYINGEEVASGAYTFGPNTVASMAIGNTTGRNGDAHNQTFNGDLDEVRIYNRALEPNEVAYLADLTPGDDKLHIPIPSRAELYSGEPEGQRRVNFKDFAVLANKWLEEEMWP